MSKRRLETEKRQSGHVIPVGLEKKKTNTTYGTISFMLINHFQFVVVVDLNDSSIFDESLEYVDLINVYLEINLH